MKRREKHTFYIYQFKCHWSAIGARLNLFINISSQKNIIEPGSFSR
jgi:hypothetical protein